MKICLKGEKNNLSNSPPPCADLLLKIQNTVLCCSHLLLCYCLWRHESKYVSWHFITLSNSVEICHSGRDLERWLVQVSAEGYKKVNISYLQVYKYIWEYKAASKKLLLGVKVLNWIPGGTNFYPICSLYQCTLYLFVYFKTSWFGSIQSSWQVPSSQCKFCWSTTAAVGTLLAFSKAQLQGHVIKMSQSPSTYSKCYKISYI